MSKSAWLLVIAVLALTGWLLMRGGADEEGPAQSEIAVDAGPEDSAEEKRAPVLLATPEVDPHEEGAAEARDATDARRAGSADGREGDTHYEGIVVDEKGKAAAGVAIVARFERRVIAEMTSDEDGKYTFWASFEPDHRAWAQGLIVAKAADGRVGTGPFLAWAGGMTMSEIDPKNRTIAPVRLGKGSPLAIDVTSSCSGGLPANIWIVPTQGAVAEALIVTATDAQGHVTVPALPPGVWRVIAAADGCGRASAVVQLPKPELAHVELELPDARTLTVTVQDKATEEVIAGAQVAVEEYVKLIGVHGRGALVSQPSVYTADEEGRVLIHGLGTTERLYLRAFAEGYPNPKNGIHGGQERVRVDPDQTEAIIRLQQARTIRWTFEDKGLGIPPDGTAIQLTPYVNSGLKDIPTSGVMDGRELVVEGWAPGFAAAIAHAEGYGAARLQSKKDATEGYPTAFYPERKIEFFAKNQDGTPATDLYLTARDPGNNAIGEPIPTNEEGYAALTGLYGGPRLAGELLRLTQGDKLGRKSSWLGGSECGRWALRLRRARRAHAARAPDDRG